MLNKYILRTSGVLRFEYSGLYAISKVIVLLKFVLRNQVAGVIYSESTGVGDLGPSRLFPNLRSQLIDPNPELHDIDLIMSSATGNRITKPKVKKARRVSKALPLVERTNALSAADFISKYASSEVDTNAVEIYSSATISSTDLEACLDLVEETSSAAYASSSGWSRTKKRKEMKLPDMKYMIVRGSGRVNGFLSFMVTYEDGKEVVYCYEIHLAGDMRGRGLGGMLMGRMEGVGRAVGVEKAMLTVFKSNGVANRFYERLGYGVDEYSPGPRRLRNGTVKEPDYLILSKGLKG
ncbi:unnamed protein product [Penicillium salamii]|nr:unnamed protein product [Penicillium salamii]CAG8408336.1 unnamed protein product [Penicillium salamii]